MKDDITTIIKNFREKNHLTQDELGQIAGVSGKAVWAWENGTSLPRMGAVQKIADKYGLTTSQFLEGDFDNKEEQNALANAFEALKPLSHAELEAVYFYIKGRLGK